MLKRHQQPANPRALKKDFFIDCLMMTVIYFHLAFLGGQIAMIENSYFFGDKSTENIRIVSPTNLLRFLGNAWLTNV